MKTISTFIILLAGALLLAACEQTPNQASEPGIRPMSQNSSSDAHPAIAFKGTVTNKGKTYNTLSVFDSDGTNETAIYTASSTTHLILVPAWSPSGGTIAFQMYDNNNGIYPSIYLRDISVSHGKAVGSNTRTLYSVSAYSTVLRGISWSSVSSTDKIAFITRDSGSYGSNKVQVISTSGGTPTVLYQSNTSEIRYYTSPTYSPDDSKIAFVDHAGPTDAALRPDTIRVINASTGVLLESIAIGSAKGTNTAIEWSRTGTNIIALTPDYGNGSLLYYVTPTTGSTPWTNNVSGTQPTWSPNSSSVVTAGGSGLQKTVYGTSSSSTIATGGFYFPEWKK